MTALVAESYMRAYSAAVRLQQLVELEEIIAVRTLEAQSPLEATVLRQVKKKKKKKEKNLFLISFSKKRLCRNVGTSALFPWRSKPILCDACWECGRCSSLRPNRAAAGCSTPACAPGSAACAAAAAPSPSSSAATLRLSPTSRLAFPTCSTLTKVCIFSFV